MLVKADPLALPQSYETDSDHMTVGQQYVPKWVALVNGNKDSNLRSISWWFNFQVWEAFLDSERIFLGVFRGSESK